MTDRARRDDRITAVVLFALGIAMLVGGFSMDRLEVRSIHPASIPGLVPMLLGAALAVCAAVLFARAGADADATAGASAAPDDDLDDADGGGSRARLLGAAAWSVVYALALVGTLPFTAATAIYVGGFVAAFGWAGARTGRERALLLAKAAALAVAGSWAIATLFSEAFLVRLP